MQQWKLRGQERWAGFAVVASEVRNLSQRCAKKLTRSASWLRKYVKISEGVGG